MAEHETSVSDEALVDALQFAIADRIDSYSIGEARAAILDRICALRSQSAQALTYAHHKPECQIHAGHYAEECTCGLMALRKQLEQAP